MSCVGHLRSILGNEERHAHFCCGWCDVANVHGEFGAGLMPIHAAHGGPHGVRSKAPHNARLPNHPRAQSRLRRSGGAFTRLVVYLSPDDVTRLGTLRASVAAVRGGRRPSTGVIVSAALRSLTGDLFACR